MGAVELVEVVGVVLVLLLLLLRTTAPARAGSRRRADARILVDYRMLLFVWLCVRVARQICGNYSPSVYRLSSD